MTVTDEAALIHRLGEKEISPNLNLSFYLSHLPQPPLKGNVYENTLNPVGKYTIQRAPLCQKVYLKISLIWNEIFLTVSPKNWTDHLNFVLFGCYRIWIMLIHCIDHGVCRRCPISGVHRHFVASQFRTTEKLFAPWTNSHYQIQRQALWVSLWCSGCVYRRFSSLHVLGGEAGVSEGTEHTSPAALRI